MSDTTLHRRVADLFAGFFHRHLIAELHKGDAVIKHSYFDGRSAFEIDNELLAKLETDFPTVLDQTPPYNLFERWFELNEFPVAYNEFAIEAYNLIYYQRLLHIRDWTEPGAKDRFHKVTHEVFRKFNYRQEGFSVSAFLRFESNMRELLRISLRENPEIDFESAWEIVFEQSREYQEVVNEFFEQILNESLAQSESLLHNILPVSVADELKAKDSVEPVLIESATVLFTDFKGFTAATENLTPKELIADLDECFSLFDEIAAEFKLEKIKTIGDSYMCAGGVPNPNKTHTLDTALAALKMLAGFEEIQRKHRAAGRDYWDIRIGIHTGPLVAGVIGKTKFSYDVWGDSVNTASRMESSGIPGRINCSQAVYDKLKYYFHFTPRGKQAAKGKGELEMFLLEGLQARFKGTGDKPGPDFVDIYQRIAAGARVFFKSELSEAEITAFGNTVRLKL